MAEAEWQNILQRNTDQLSSLHATCQATPAVHFLHGNVFHFSKKRKRRKMKNLLNYGLICHMQMRNRFHPLRDSMSILCLKK